MTSGEMILEMVERARELEKVAMKMPKETPEEMRQKANQSKYVSGFCDAVEMMATLLKGD